MASIKTAHTDVAATIDLFTPTIAQIRQCNINFTAIQTGTGTPSINNIRPITGYNSIQLYMNKGTGLDSTYTLSLGNDPGTAYSGYVDLITGELTLTHYLARGAKSTFGNRASGTANGTYYRNSNLTLPSSASNTSWNNARAQQMFNMGTIANPYSEAATYGTEIGLVYNAAKANGTLRISQTIYQALGDNDYVQILYKLATPLTYTLTSQEIYTLLGYNHIWSNGDTIELVYDLYETYDMMRLRQRFFLNKFI